MEYAKPIQVLVFSVDQMMMDGLRQSLGAHVFDIREAHSIEETLQFVRLFDPDVVVLDLLVLGIESQQVCTRMRTFSKTPILVLSAASTPEIIASALDQGADDYLLKPVPGSVIIAHLKKLARRGRAEFAPRHISPLELR